ncbi:hypothetical protein Q0S19_15800, partial [Stenotrophomonas indicatrix]|nr:hypothetical protein [Stenotrophomonas indicatrix]
MQWLIWGTGTLVFGAIIVGVFVAAWRGAGGPPGPGSLSIKKKITCPPPFLRVFIGGGPNNKKTGGG